MNQARPDTINTFRDALRTKSFSLLGQLRLHEDNTREDVINQASTLAEAVDAVSITDSPNGVLHMSGLAISALLLNEGIDPVLQLSTRDRNRIALKSELLGAAALGVTSFLLHRGDPLPKNEKPNLTQVFDTGAKRFLKTASQLSKFQVAQGKPALQLGTLATAFGPEEDWQPIELSAKVDAGANFVQTQICLDLALLERYMRFLVAAKLTWRCQIIVSIPVLTTPGAARWLYENMRGSVVPASVVAEFESAPDPEAHGIQFAANMLQAVKEIPGVSGANLSCTGDPEHIIAAVKTAGLDD
ncbi:MAG: methylenetetrahydrofolate reductase [Pseudomonadota bacterium]